MRHLLHATTLLFVLPLAAHAQIDIQLPTLDRPVLRANLGAWSVSASLDEAGRVDLRLDDRSIGGGTAEPSTRPTSRAPSTTTSRAPSTTTRRAPTSTRRTASRATASAVLSTGEDYLGVPYVWGGTTPRGFDCSGFVQYIYRQHGIELPRTSRQQVKVGQVVPATRSALREGDLMFFATNGVRIDHIAIYAGGDEILHSSKSGGGVGYDRLSSKRGQWFVDHHVATRRVIANGQSLVRQLDAALRAWAEYDPPDRAPRR